MTMLELAERLGNAGFRWLVEMRPTDDPTVADRLAQFETEITGLRGLCRQTRRGQRGRRRRSRRRVDRQAVLQRTAAADDRLRRRGRRSAAHTVLTKPMSSGWESGAWVLDFIGSWEWTIPAGPARSSAPSSASAGSACRGNRGGLMQTNSRSSTTNCDRSRAICSPRTARSTGRCSSTPGWTGLEVPEQLGGAGASFVEIGHRLRGDGPRGGANGYLGGAVWPSVP